ncbi:hypothetical protein ACQ4PT_012801 [Festuca glaucescens]
MDDPGGTSSSQGEKTEDVGDLLGRLHLQDNEIEDFIWEDEAEEPKVQAKWLSILVDNNLFTIQFNCLADWNRAINQGPWLFRNQALIIEEYDGFANPKSIKLDRVAVWAQVHQQPDNFLKEKVIKGMCRGVGKVKEVQIKLPEGFVGSFIRIKVRLDVNKKLSRFASISKDKKKEYYQVKYEKSLIFVDNVRKGVVGDQVVAVGVEEESKEIGDVAWEEVQ